MSSTELQVHHEFERPSRRRRFRPSPKQWLWIFPVMVVIAIGQLIVIHWFVSAVESGTAGLWILTAALIVLAVVAAAIISYVLIYMLIWVRDAKRVELVLETIKPEEGGDGDSLALCTQRVGGFDSGLAVLGRTARGKGMMFICRIQKGSLTLWPLKNGSKPIARIDAADIEGFEVESIALSKREAHPRFSAIVRHDGRVVLLPLTVLRAPKGTSPLLRAAGYRKLIDNAESALRTGKVSAKVSALWEE